MAKIQIKSEKLTPFGGIFSTMEQFGSTLSSVIDSTLGLRVYHQCSVPTILQVVTPISFLKKVIMYRFAEDKLHSAM